jgi:hypothetical protein
MMAHKLATTRRGFPDELRTHGAGPLPLAAAGVALALRSPLARAERTAGPVLLAPVGPGRGPVVPPGQSARSAAAVAAAVGLDADMGGADRPTAGDLAIVPGPFAGAASG